MKAVIDTNVLLVANGDHADVSPDCRAECVRRLQAMQATGVTVIDDAFLILGEYLNKTRVNPPKGVGDAFLKWLLREAGNSKRVDQVSLTTRAENRFAEFPDPTLEREFDADDRKFVAVANAHDEKPPVWQAADAKWLDWWQPLAAHGVHVDFLCPADVSRIYKKKFSGRPAPLLPQADTP
jgi:hypothetical protein